VGGGSGGVGGCTGAGLRPNSRQPTRENRLSFQNRCCGGGGASAHLSPRSRLTCESRSDGSVGCCAGGGGAAARWHAHTYCASCSRDHHGRIKRSESAKHKFLKPKGLTHVPKGYEVDHIVPLSKGGADTPSNMQLLSHGEHEAKTGNDLK